MIESSSGNAYRNKSITNWKMSKLDPHKHFDDIKSELVNFEKLCVLFEHTWLIDFINPSPFRGNAVWENMYIYI